MQFYHCKLLFSYFNLACNSQNCCWRSCISSNCNLFILCSFLICRIKFDIYFTCISRFYWFFWPFWHCTSTTTFSIGNNHRFIARIFKCKCKFRRISLYYITKIPNRATLICKFESSSTTIVNNLGINFIVCIWFLCVSCIGCRIVINFVGCIIAA